jgi:hypothetical protein
MGVSTSPYVAQQVAWLVARKLRRRGLRVLSYCDDWLVACKPDQVATVVAAVEAEFARHGLVVNAVKTHSVGEKVLTALGIEIDLDDFVFRVPAEKVVGISADIEALLADAAAVPPRPVSIRSLAQVVGKLMATHIAVGDVARRETRSSYRFIAELTGVPPDATRRELKVAWDCTGIAPDVVVDELRLWQKFLPLHKGSPIRELEPVPCSIWMASDASDTAWAGFIDTGQGWRAVARELLSSLI